MAASNNVVSGGAAVFGQKFDPDDPYAWAHSLGRIPDKAGGLLRTLTRPTLNRRTASARLAAH
jgi:hypothetical protein